MSCLFLFTALWHFIFDTWSIRYNGHASADCSVMILSQNSSLNSESISIWMVWLENLSVWGYCECLLMLSKILGSSSSWVCCSLEGSTRAAQGPGFPQALISSLQAETAPVPLPDTVPAWSSSAPAGCSFCSLEHRTMEWFVLEGA